MEYWRKELSEELVRAKAEGGGRKDGCQILAKSMQARWRWMTDQKEAEQERSWNVGDWLCLVIESEEY